MHVFTTFSDPTKPVTLTMKQLDYITKTLMISKGAEEVAKQTAKQLKEGTFIHPGLFVVPLC